MGIFHFILKSCTVHIRPWTSLLIFPSFLQHMNCIFDNYIEISLLFIYLFFSSRLYCYTGNVAFTFPRVHELFLILFLSFYRCGVYGYRLVHRKLLFHGPCERQDICLQLGRRHMCHSHRCGPGEPQKHGSWSFCGVSISVHLLHTCYDCNWNSHSFFFGLLSTRETRGFWLANRLCVDV